MTIIMLALARTRWWTPDNNLLTVDVFDGAEWTAVVHKEIGKYFHLMSTRNTNRLIMRTNYDKESSDLYSVCDGSLNCISRKVTGPVNWLYETSNGIHQLSSSDDDKCIQSKNISERNWKDLVVPEKRCRVSASCDDELYIIVDDKSDLYLSHYSPNVHVAGYIDGEYWILASIVDNGIVHIYNANKHSIVRYDPRMSFDGITVFSGADRPHDREHRLSMFYNGHTFIKVWLDQTVEMVDLRNLSVWSLPSLNCAFPHDVEVLGIYG